MTGNLYAGSDCSGACSTVTAGRTLSTKIALFTSVAGDIRCIESGLKTPFFFISHEHINRPLISSGSKAGPLGSYDCRVSGDSDGRPEAAVDFEIGRVQSRF